MSHNRDDHHEVKIFFDGEPEAMASGPTPCADLFRNLAAEIATRRAKSSASLALSNDPPASSLPHESNLSKPSSSSATSPDTAELSESDRLAAIVERYTGVSVNGYPITYTVQADDLGWLINEVELLRARVHPRSEGKVPPFDAKCIHGIWRGVECADCPDEAKVRPRSKGGDEDIRAAAQTLIANASMIGVTDSYAISYEDLDALRSAVGTVGSEHPRSKGGEGEISKEFDELFNCYTASKCIAADKGDREEFLRLKGMAEAYQDAATRIRNRTPSQVESEAATVKKQADLNRCPGCGKEEPPPPPGPPRVPGQWYCVNHRHLKPRTDFA